MGHKSTDCWTLDKNKDKFPRNFKTKESANVSLDKPKYHCDWCGKNNNTEDRCFAKKNGKPKVEKETANTAASSGKTPLLLCINKNDA
jgi:hypothetical protein